MFAEGGKRWKQYWRFRSGTKLPGGWLDRGGLSERQDFPEDKIGMGEGELRAALGHEMKTSDPLCSRNPAQEQRPILDK